MQYYWRKIDFLDLFIVTLLQVIRRAVFDNISFVRKKHMDYPLMHPVASNLRR